MPNRRVCLAAAIVIFATLFYSIQLFKPYFLYNEDGSIKQFGIGYKKKTILPMWVISIVVAILCYLAVLYYLTIPRLNY